MGMTSIAQRPSKAQQISLGDEARLEGDGIGRCAHHQPHRGCPTTAIVDLFKISMYLNTQNMCMIYSIWYKYIFIVCTYIYIYIRVSYTVYC